MNPFHYSMPALLAVVLCAECQRPSPYHRIEVVDEATGRGIPLVELNPFNSVRYCTDSNGLIAFHEPHLMGREIYFDITSHGYGAPIFAGTDLRGGKIRQPLLNAQVLGTDGASTVVFKNKLF